ncbi:MAG: M20/M25/M40 family metallo-hydrolase, partial [Ignavibacteria bacterium]|nr:M20/M25/M40 family metallo-hydrolase [Ignavibacteria bacterium]
ILSILDGEGIQDENFPQLHIDIDVANELLHFNKITLQEIQRRIDSTKSPFSFRLGSKVKFEVNAKYYKEKQTMNVVGMIEGSDKKLKDEYLVIGAHLDHVGSQANEIYAPGANDNASGSSAVLEIAEAFIKSGVKPKRSIIFVLFASEELGLFGSRHFVSNPPVPLEKIVAMINLDCVGFGDSIQVGNGKSAPILWQIAKSLDSVHTKQMVPNTWSGGGADASPFHDKGIPSLYFVTTNSYAHLHYTTDTPETLNQTLFENITKLAFLTASYIANGEYQRESVLK